MAQRIVKKSLAGRQDILFGNGQVTQTRAGGSYPINKVSMLWACTSHAELLTLDTTQFTQATVNYQGSITHWGWTGTHWYCQETDLTLIGSFETGFTYTTANQVGCTATDIYSYDGNLPNVVVPGTNPAIAGSGYVQRTDVVLRSVVSLTFPTIADIDESQLSVGTTVAVENYSTDCKSGMLLFKVAALGTGVHDGGKYIDLTNFQLVQNLRKPFSVMAWGACGNSNGTSGNGADDRNAIYNCYKYAASSSARSAEVFFPRPDGNNCYRMGSGFEVNESDYTYFVGEGGHYTASKILVDFNGIAIYRNTGQFGNSFRNLVFQSANPAGYTAAAAIYSVGTVESTLEEVSFLDFGGIACNLNACFGVRVVHPLVAGNYSVGLKLSGGSGNLLDTPIFQDNLGTAGIVEGAGWTILNPYWENNCKRNDPATENGSYYNLYVNATQTTIVGGTLNQYPQDTKVPIRVASADVTIINMNVYSLAATHVAHIESSSASLSLIGCSWSEHVSGYTANLFTSVTPLAGYRKADVTLSGRSVSDNLSSAWCNFNGTLASPISPRQGSNVSNITKLGTGIYRVNFQTTMSTNTYMVNPAAGGSNNSVYASYGTKDAGFVEIYVRDAAGVLTDVSDVSVEIKEIKPV